jgi:hypothetical protein
MDGSGGKVQKVFLGVGLSLNLEEEGVGGVSIPLQLNFIHLSSMTPSLRFMMCVPHIL